MTGDAGTDSFAFRSSFGRHLFLTQQSQIFDLPGDSAAERSGDTREATPPPPARLPLLFDDLEAPTAISLNVAQSCNLACGYCYADHGNFNAPPKDMAASTAYRHVERLIESSPSGASLLVGFMGGEPLLNRALLHDVVAYAFNAAERSGRKMRFSVTTNATLLTDADAALFSDFPFTVQVSLDGRKDLHNRQRPMRNGRGSYDLAIRGIDRLLARRPRSLSVRMTATPGASGLKAELDAMLALGVDDAGFAPVLVSPTGDEFGREALTGFLDEMLICGEAALAATLLGRRYAFTNFETAIKELHRGAHRPLPCGAGANYISAGADGNIYACHRMVGEPRALLGNVMTGIDPQKRRNFLLPREVDAVEPCSRCWARYLCGGGCHHEVMQRGRIACDYIRGWLAFCLRAYVEISEQIQHRDDGASG